MNRIASLILLLVSTFTWAQETKVHTCYFDNDIATLNEPEKASFIAWFQTLPPNASFILEGHTDEVGSQAYNKVLSQKRSITVKGLLLELGVAQDSVVPQFFGELKPTKTNETEEGKQLNRRVKITAQFISDTSTIWQLFRLLDNGYQTFEINPAKDTLLKGKQGTFLKIPANAFSLPPNCNAQKITIRLKEAYKTSDMLMQNLSTTSNGEILETRGMTYLDAQCGNTTLGLAPNMKITHIMPIKSPVSDMKFFSGEFPNSDSTINWVEEKEANLGVLPADLMAECPLNGGSAPCKFFFCKIRKH